MERARPYSPDLPELADNQPAGYYEAKVADIKAGKKVWMTRNFDSNLGRMLDFFADGKFFGSVECDETHPDWRGLQASQPMLRDETEGAEYLTAEPLPLGEAMRVVEQE